MVSTQDEILMVAELQYPKLIRSVNFAANLDTLLGVAITFDINFQGFNAKSDSTPVLKSNVIYNT